MRKIREYSVADMPDTEDKPIDADEGYITLRGRKNGMDLSETKRYLPPADARFS